MVEASEQLPIDISFSKLAEWLVDRKRLPADWRKRLLPIRSKIAAALPSLPKNLHPSFPSLSAEVVGYLEAKHILSVLTVAKPETRTLFGRYTGVVGDWDAIVRAYEKDLLFLGENAQVMIQTVKYEIPYLKKQIMKSQQQLADMERKETESKRNATAAAVKYQEACQELGINGTNIRGELLATTRNLPLIFAKVEDLLCSELVTQAVNCYEAFVSYSLGKERQDDVESVVPSLKTLQNGHSNLLHLISAPSDNGTSRDDVPSSERTDVATEQPNSMISSNENPSTSIDWDIALVEEPVEPSQENVFNEEMRVMDPPAGLVASPTVAVQDETTAESLQVGGIDWDTDNKVSSGEEASEIQWDIGNSEQWDISPSEIQWDISVDDSTDHANVPPLMSLESNEGEQEQTQEAIKNRFMETEYRNSLLNDLLEIRSFLALKSGETSRQDTSSLQNQVQATLPQHLQQYEHDLFQGMSVEVLQAIRKLTDKKTRDLIMIATSQRFLKRLEMSLLQKKQQESKLLENLKELGQKQLELRSLLAVIWPKQEAAVQRIREMKEQSEKTITTLYEGRRVNIIGEINSVLGQS